MAGIWPESDFEIIHEQEHKDILVPGFFNYNKNRTPDHRILILEETAGLMGDYGDEINPVLRELIGKELMVYVVHKYKKVDNTQSLIFC